MQRKRNRAWVPDKRIDAPLFGFLPLLLAACQPVIARYGQQSLSLQENQATGGEIGLSFDATDADTPQDQLVWGVSDDRFALRQKSDGRHYLVLKAGQSLDYESANAYRLNLTISDTGGSRSDSVWFKLINQDESQAVSNQKSGTSYIYGNKGNSNFSHIDWLLHYYKWGGIGKGVDLKYSFWTGQHGTSATDHGSGNNKARHETITPALKAAVRDSLDQFSEVCLLNFSEITESTNNTGTLRFGAVYDGVKNVAYAYLPYSWSANGGNIWLNNDENKFNSASNLNDGKYYKVTITHEIGHAIGLSHTQDNYGTDVRQAWSEDNTLAYSIMAYAENIGDPLGNGSTNNFQKPTTLMMNDIAALQYLYGKNEQTAAGDTLWTLNSFTNKDYIYATIWDANGNDTFSWAGKTTDCQIDLRPGHFSFFGNIDSLSDYDLIRPRGGSVTHGV